MAFINTLDIIGDEAYTDLILTGEIAEVRDAYVTKLRSYALIYTSVVLVDLPNCVQIGSYSFYSCGNLKTLILRSSSVSAAAHSNMLDRTPIKSGTGYIYVPSALIDTYKTATNWSTYAAQFRALEDYTVDGTTTGDLDETKI